MPKIPLPSGAVITRYAVVAFGAALFLEQAGARRILHLDNAGAPVMAMPVYCASLLAPAFFLWALWAAAAVSARINRGTPFGVAMVCGLKQMGTALMLGAFAAIVVQPAIVHLVGNGFREMRGARLDWRVENVTLVLIGLMLLQLARQGEALKARLEEFV